MNQWIAMLWLKGRPTFLEQLCIASLADAGHRVILFGYTRVDGFRKDAEFRDAHEICPEDGGLLFGAHPPIVDRFRYRLLEREGGIIVTSPTLCCTGPLETRDGHLHATHAAGDIFADLLALPPDGETLARLLQLTSDPYAVPPFKARYTGKTADAFAKAEAAGERMHVAEQPPGVWGGHALTHFLRETGDIAFTDRNGRIAEPDVETLLNPGQGDPENAQALILPSQEIARALANEPGGLPHPDSLLGRLLCKHRIDPADAPLPAMHAAAPDDQRLQHYRDAAERRKRISAEPVKSPIRPLDDVVAITTMRNEGAFILDWIAYHRTIGITHFLVYTNHCDDTTDAILHALQRRGLVTRLDNPMAESEKPQRKALEHAQMHPKVAGAAAWVVMDIDEYINIHVGEGTLSDLFAAAGDPDMISMTWRLFGSSDHVEYQDSPVPLTFTRAAPRHTRKPHQAWGMKTICRRGVPFGRLGVHRPLEPTGEMPRWTNGSGVQMPDSYLEDGWRSSKHSWGYDLVTLNHYAVRSAESFLVKRDRGRTNHVARPQGADYWAVFNRNDEDDSSIRSNWERATVLRNVFAKDPELTKLHGAAVAWHRKKIEALKAVPGENALLEELTSAVPKEEPPAPEADHVVPDIAPPATQAVPLRSDAPPTGQAARDAFRGLMERVQARQEMLSPPGTAPGSERIVIVTSMKNEGCFILEWIAYHLSIGVTHFVVYTNDCDDPTNAVLDRLAALGHVTRCENPYNRDAGQKPQRGALNDAATRPEVTSADWVGVIDCDEFVNIHTGEGTFASLLNAANHPNVISMTWRTFGNRGVHAYDDTWQTETFTACAPEYLPKPRLGWGFKSFFRADAPFAKIGVHRPLHLDEARADEVRWVNGSGRVMPERLVRKNEWFSRKDTIGYDLVTLNHYVLRSAESFLVKRQRGRINHVDQDQGLGYWASRNYTSETDTRILAHLPRAKEVLADLMADSELAELHVLAVDWHRNRIATLMASPDYRALYDAITDPDLPDAIWRAQPEKAPSVQAAE